MDVRFCRCDDAETQQLNPCTLHPVPCRCDDAETQQLKRPPPSQPQTANRCRRITPPDEIGDLGWRGLKVSGITNLDPLLYRFRCW